MEKKQDPRQSIREWLDGKSIEDLDVVENGNRLLFSDSIKRIGPKGTLIEEPVRLQVPRQVETMKARIEAIALAAKYKIDREKETDLFDELNMVCELSYAVREAEAPYGQKYLPEQYLGAYDYVSLFDLYHRIKVYRNMIDPRLSEPKVEDVIDAACKIAEMRNVSPLAAIAGSDLDSSIITMARLLVNCMTQLSTQQSPETSTAV